MGTCSSFKMYLTCNVCLQAAVMDLVDSDKQGGLTVPVWVTYRDLLTKTGTRVKQPVYTMIE